MYIQKEDSLLIYDGIDAVSFEVITNYISVTFLTSATDLYYKYDINALKRKAHLELLIHPIVFEAVDARGLISYLEDMMQYLGDVKEKRYSHLDFEDPEYNNAFLSFGIVSDIGADEIEYMHQDVFDVYIDKNDAEKLLEKLKKHLPGLEKAELKRKVGV